MAARTHTADEHTARHWPLRARKLLLQLQLLRTTDGDLVRHGTATKGGGNGRRGETHRDQSVGVEKQPDDGQQHCDRQPCRESSQRQYMQHTQASRCSTHTGVLHAAHTHTHTHRKLTIWKLQRRQANDCALTLPALADRGHDLPYAGEEPHRPDRPEDIECQSDVA